MCKHPEKKKGSSLRNPELKGKTQAENRILFSLSFYLKDLDILKGVTEYRYDAVLQKSELESPIFMIRMSPLVTTKEMLSPVIQHS